MTCGAATKPHYDPATSRRRQGTTTHKTMFVVVDVKLMTYEDECEDDDDTSSISSGSGISFR